MGSDEADYDWLKGHKTGSWSCLKETKKGDFLFIYFTKPHCAIVASAIASDDAVPNKKWRYRVAIKDIKLLAKPITRDEMLSRFPKWGWPRFTRNTTYPPDSIAKRLLDLAGSKQAENHAPRSTNRRKFIELQGATCINWYFSWSFVNHAKRFVIFGAWDRDTVGKRTKIFSEDWRENKRGQKPAYGQSLEHIRLVEEEGYRLMTFPMHWKDGEDGRPTIGGFTPKLTKRKLTKVGPDWFASDFDDGSSVVLAEEISSPEKYSEGARVSVTINAYERNPKARTACIAHHGYVCAVCGFDFGRVFGDLGEGFIHVHHVVPIRKIGKEYKINPIKDLIPVCPNCHAMIHRAEPPFTVKQLRQHISDLKKA